MKKEYQVIDIMKFILAFLVVAIHTNPLINYQETYIYHIWSSITSIAVPYYFMATGFLLACKQKQNVNSVLFHHLKKLFFLYIIWNIIYLPLAIWNYWRSEISVTHAILDYIRGFIFIGEHYNSYILWYILSTIYVLIFLIVFTKIKLPFPIIVIICIVIGLLGSIFTGYANKTFVCSGIINKILSLYVHLMYNGRLLTGFIYVPLGMLLYKKKRNSPNFVIMIAIAISIILQTHTKFEILKETFRLISVVGLFILTNTSKSMFKNDFISLKLRHISTTIYFIHLWIWTISYTIIYGEKRYGSFMFLVVSFLSLTIGYMITVIKNIRVTNN